MRARTRTMTALPAVLTAGLLLSACSDGQDGADEPTESAQAESQSETDGSTQGSPAPGEGTTVLTPDDQEQMAGDAETFTGDVTVTLLAGDEQTAVAPGLVEFEPGARTAWHTHPAGQRLIITDGTGWVQEEGGERLEVTSGDVVWCDPEVKHWHGATEDEAVSHIAIAEAVDGSDVEWMEHVTDAQYAGEEA